MRLLTLGPMTLTYNLQSPNFAQLVGVTSTISCGFSYGPLIVPLEILLRGFGPLFHSLAYCFLLVLPVSMSQISPDDFRLRLCFTEFL